MRALPLALLAFMVPAMAVAATVAPAVTVIVTFSPKAQQAMTTNNEAVTIAADFYGEPKRLSDLPQHDNDGLFHAGEGQLTMPMSGYVAGTISGVRLDPKQMQKTKPPLKLNVNVFSARHSSRLNILNCEAFDDAADVAAQQPVKIVCKLIGE